MLLLMLLWHWFSQHVSQLYKFTTENWFIRKFIIVLPCQHFFPFSFDNDYMACTCEKGDARRADDCVQYSVRERETDIVWVWVFQYRCRCRSSLLKFKWSVCVCPWNVNGYLSTEWIWVTMCVCVFRSRIYVCLCECFSMFVSLYQGVLELRVLFAGGVNKYAATHAENIFTWFVVVAIYQNCHTLHLLCAVSQHQSHLI